MCYSKSLSLLSFLFGTFSSLLLIKFGNDESSSTNKVLGLFYIFVSFMQFIEYLLWSDLKCNNGKNKLASLLGPLFNHFQPVVLLVLCSYYLDSQNIIPKNILITVNLLYIIYTIYKYIKYIKNKNNLCTQLNDVKHLDWKWKYDFNYKIYIFLNFFNLVNFYTNKNLSSSVIVSYLLLFISYFKFNKNIGEFWCLMVTGVPLFNLLIQKFMNINN